jgi:hypothetical protein
MKPSLDQLRSILQTPANGAKTQAAFNAQRMADVEKAARIRPHFLPISHTLPAAAATAPIIAATEPLNHDVIIGGAITNGESRNVKPYTDIDTDAPPMVRFGSQANLRFPLDAIAGHSVATAGFPGVYRWPEPLLLRRTETFTIEMYQEANPGATELVSTVLVGERDYTATSDEGTLNDKIRGVVQSHIIRRPAPETRYAVIPVTFDADGNCSTETPRSDEPLLLLGFRSTFTDALINFGFDGDNAFAKSKFAIWALCAEPNNTRQLFQMLQSPLFIPPSVQLPMSLVNTIDSNLISPGGNIIALLRTV